jgi:protein TonB
MERKVEGRVDLEAVVLPDGSTGPIRVTGSLDPDLDLSAVAAIRAWRFEPAMLNGKTVPSMVEVEMTFRLK